MAMASGMEANTPPSYGKTSRPRVQDVAFSTRVSQARVQSLGHDRAGTWVEETMGLVAAMNDSGVARCSARRLCPGVQSRPNIVPDREVTDRCVSL